jgi:hypothetical protein
MKKLIGILAVIILLSSCGSTNNYALCPAYASLDCENCDEID